MKRFKIIVTKTIETEILVNAESLEIAMEQMAGGNYDEEIDYEMAQQWNVTDSDYDIWEVPDKVVCRWARKCDATGEGMNQGYVYGDGEKYFKYEKDLIAYIREGADESFNDASDEFLLNQAYELDEYYWTEWESPEEDQWYELEDGSIIYDENK